MSNKKINVGIIWADPYNGNLGVGALAFSSLSLLYDVLQEKGISANFSFVCTSEYKKDVVQINNKTIEFDSFPALNYFKVKSLLQLLLLSKRFKTKKLLSFDYVFDISAGDSFADIYGVDRYELVINSKRFFNLFKIKQILLPQTIGPFKNPVFEKQAFSVMSKMKAVISRDKQSYDYTVGKLPKDKIAETVDVAFYMPFERSSYNDGKIHVGINVSGLLWNGGYTKNDQFGMKTDYKELIIDTIKYFTSNPDVQVHLIPHVIPTEDAVEDDYSVSEIIKGDFPSVIIAPRFGSPIEAKGYISGMDFFTGARMHACIGAFSSAVPVYLMAYSRKFNGLFVDTLQYKWMGDCVNESNDVVLTRLKEAFEKRKELKNDIDNSLDKIVKPRIKLLKEILSATFNAN